MKNKILDISASLFLFLIVFVSFLFYRDERATRFPVHIKVFTIVVGFST